MFVLKERISLKAIDISGYENAIEHMEEKINFAIKEVNPVNVVQFVINNAAFYKE